MRYAPFYPDGSRVERGDTIAVPGASFTILGWDTHSKAAYLILRDTKGDLKIANAYEMGAANIYWHLTPL